MVSLYRSPSQTEDQFNEFLLNFEQLLSNIISCNPRLLLIAGDFNVRTLSWWRKNLEGTQIEALTCSYRLSQLKTSDIASVLNKEFLDILANIECGFTLKMRT